MLLEVALDRRKHHGDVRFGLKDRPQATTDEWLVVNQ